MSDTNKPKRSFKWPVGYIVAGLVAATTSVAIFSGAQYYLATRSEPALTPLDNPAAASEGRAPAASSTISKLNEFSQVYRQVAREIGPAVVSIKATKGAPKQKLAQRGKRGGRRSPEEEEFRDPFMEFFERFGAPTPYGSPQQESPQTSLGSGFIIDKKGYIVTNNHVVEDAAEVIVTLADQKTDIKAKIIGTDARTDLAVLKAETTKELPSTKWANSDNTEVGDIVLAIGSPFALGQTVTQGIVSAKGRSSLALTGSDSGDLIQTDAAINPGNSGGPLCILEKEVVGVNTAIYTRSGGYMGIGFAIPSNLARDIVDKLIRSGKVVRGWLGVYIQPLDGEAVKDPNAKKSSGLGKKLGIKDGIVIHEVIDESPAAKAGLEAGDVILDVDNQGVKDVTQLQRTISNFKPGQTVKLRVVSLKQKTPRNVTVKIGELPQNEGPQKSGGGGEDASFDKLGLAVSSRGNEVLVEAIEPGSAADGGEMGLRHGDVISRIDESDIKSLSDYKKAMKSAKGTVSIWAKRGGMRKFFQLPLKD